MMKNLFSKVVAKIADNPKTYTRTYKAYNWLNREVINPRSYIRVISSFVVLVCISAISGNVFIGASSTVSLYLLSLIFSGVLWIIIRKHLKNTGTKIKFIFPGRYLQKRKDKKDCLLQLQGVDFSRFKFAGPEEFHIAADLNFRAFRRSAWGTSYEEKFARNSAHIQRNKWCFLLIKDKNDPEKYIGYTHVFPVSKEVWDEYMDGKLGDNDFSELDIVPTIPSTADQKPYGLIIFSVASVGIAREFEKSENYCKEVGDLFEQTLAHHINILTDKFFSDSNSKERIPVLLQNEGESFLKFFKGWGVTRRISKDGARIFKFNILTTGENISTKKLLRVA